MQLNSILDVAIGLVFVWFTISLATLEIQNRLSTWLDLRAEHLARFIFGMLRDETLVKKFYEHPLIMELAPRGKDGLIQQNRKGEFKIPEQIPSALFARVACEIMLNAGRSQPVGDSASLADMKASVEGLLKKNPNLGEVNKYLMPKIDEKVDQAEAVLQKYRKNAEEWFDNVMVQASTTYKLSSQKWALLIGLIVALTLNVDSIEVAQRLWHDPSTRAFIVAQAEASAKQHDPELSPATTDEILLNAYQATQSIPFPVGWSRAKFMSMNTGSWIVKGFGVILSAIFAAQGAPFWFDILRKLVSFKQQVTPDEDKKEKA